MAHRRGHRHVLSIVLTLLVAGAAHYVSKHPEQIVRLTQKVPAGSYVVTEFIDGDTIAVNMNGKQEKIRMIGVDTPETHDPRKAVECFGQAAAAYTKQLIGNGPVRLEADPLSTNRDRYDRLLRYVYTNNGDLVEAEIIKNGYGFAYLGFPFTKSDEFRRDEEQARSQNKGLWSGCKPYFDPQGHIHSNPAS